MKIRTAAVSALLALGSLPLPSLGAPAPVRMQVWEITRTSWAPSRLAVEMNVGYDDNRTILAVTFLRRQTGGYKVLPGAHVSSREVTSSPEAYANGEHVTCSVAAPSCVEEHGYALMTAYYNDNGRNDPVAPDTVIAVTYGRNAVVGVGGSKQWRVRRVSRAARAVWSTDTDTAAGVWYHAMGGEVFTTASAKGGPRGSVAIGVPPCSGAHVGVTMGVGTASLSGGVAPVEVMCPRDVLRPSQVARKSTTWTFSGTTAGLTAELVSEPGTVRLLVVDF